MWCFVLEPQITGLVLAGLTVLSAAYISFVYFGRPRSAVTLDGISGHGWRMVDLGPETISGNGTRYAIYVRRGSSANLIIHFSGGGACWDGESASRPITPLRVMRGYTRDLRAFYFASLTRLFPAALTGLANRRDRKNPFRDWTFVFIPYSTGDMHVGDTVNRYLHRGREVAVHHNGHANVRAALAWVFANCRDVGKVMVSGESSGAWGSAFYAPLVADHYEGKQIYCLSDGAGIVSSRWPDLFERVWRADAVQRLGFQAGDDVYFDALAHRTDGRERSIKYLHANTLYDDTLTRFDAALNRRPTATEHFIDDWASNTRASMKRLSESGLDYHYFLTDWGHDVKRHTTAHTVTTNELFHRCASDGIDYAHWLERNVIDDEDLSVGGRLLAEPGAPIPRCGE